MATEIINLQNELQQAKNSLKHVEDDIKKLTGRDPSELDGRIQKRQLGDEKNKFKIKVNKHEDSMYENEEPLAKRRPSVFERLSERVYDSDIPQKGLYSKVIVKKKEVPSREEILQAQNVDEKSKARNRRMFGALIGTLQKFQQEETKLQQKEMKRAKLEKKIEDHVIKEKEDVKRERQELFLSRRKKQAEIKIIEMKMMRINEHALWERRQKSKRNFIKTKAQPPIYYHPRRLNDKTKELLEASRIEIDDIIKERKEQLANELRTIEERIKKKLEHKVEHKEKKEKSERKDKKNKNSEKIPDIPDEVRMDTEETHKKDESVKTEINNQINVDHEENGVVEPEFKIETADEGSTGKNLQENNYDKTTVTETTDVKME